MKGKIKWFGKEKGFGFITGEDGLDIFFHISNVKGSELPDSGDAVSFEVETKRDGRSKASAVTIVSKAPKTEARKEPPYYGKPRYETKTKYHMSFAAQLGGALGRGSAIGSLVGSVVGEMVGKSLGFGSTTSSSQYLATPTRTCIRCGGTAHYTGSDGSQTGFQCERCKRFWTSRT